MASPSSLLSAENFSCSICLEVFASPVTLPCGHNFCKACITTCWDGDVQYRCPMCKECFNTRPELRVNTFISELAQQVRVLCVEDELKSLQQHEVDLTLDPDTAYHKLILSQDGKQVHDGDKMKRPRRNPKRFSQFAFVLTKQSFSSGRFYFEVQVKEKTHWGLGVVSESINRKRFLAASPEYGFWIIWLHNGNEYKAFCNPRVPLSLRTKPQKVGVFVDYDEGVVSFYDVESRVHIYSFTGCTFREPIYPFLGPHLSYDGENSAPMIISPVNQRH